MADPVRTAVVVGASQAGLTAARTLRRHGFDGRLVVVGDEPHAPYDRPPLSKQVLAGTWDADRTALTTDADGGLDIEWRLGVRATALDVAGRRVALADGDDLRYDGLVVATGARPRHHPGTEGLEGVHVLRTLDDCLAVRSALDAGVERVLVVGAGFIGAEVAATCRGRGHDVTLVEPLPVPLGRALGEEVGTVLADVHRDHGVDVRLGAGVAALEGRGRVERAVLTDGSEVPCDLAVVGIGVVPATDWLEGSGLALDDGVLTDATCRAGPGIVAAGDVARWQHVGLGGAIRVEHWDNAIAMGAHAATTLLAGDEATPFAPVPWFWSDQYDHKVLLAGRTAGAEEVRVVDGSLEERRFVALYRRGDRVVAALGLGRPAPLARWRARLAEPVPWEEAVGA